MIPFSPPRIDQKVIDEVVDTLKSGWITTGPKTKEFERRLTAYCGNKATLAVNSNTVGLEVVLRWFGVQEGDEVIVPAYTYCATANVIVHCGAKPVMVDVNAEDFDVCLENVRKAITDKTKVIMPVDLGGMPCDYDELFELVKSGSVNSLFQARTEEQEKLGRILILSDSAHSVGAEYKGRKAGCLADVSVFSFHAVKNLTTAEGGAVTWRRDLGLDDAALYRRYMLLSLHGQDKDALAKTKAGAWEYDIVAPLYKCNMTDIMAAIGLAQLHRYEELLAKRYALVEQYHELLASTAIRPARHLTEDGRSSCHLYLTELEGKTLSQRNAVIDALAQQGIASNVHYKPLPLLTAYRDLGFRMEDYPNAYGLYERELTLPLYSTLTQAQAERICGALREIL